MPTKINPSDIKAVDKTSYGNLNDEILGIKSSISSANKAIGDTVTEFNGAIKKADDSIKDMGLKVDNISSEVATMKETVNNIVINVETVKEVVDARNGFVSLDDRLDHIEGLDIFKNGLNLSSQRIYEYNSDGYITKEIVSGDINYEIHYEYDVNNNITKENHYYNNNLIGNKTYTYNNDGSVVKVISDNADVLELVTQKGVQADLDKRIKSIEDIGISNELDLIKRTIFIGEYDGKEILDKVTNMDERVKVIEDLMPNKIYDILDLPALLKRLDSLEYILANAKSIYSFIYKAGTNTYLLPKKISTGDIKVYVEGVVLVKGVTQDYIILEDNQTIKFIVPILDGCQITCEYY